ncbi:MAG: 50S ribosomal protein L25 [Flavobacteriales bacterium]|nr:50S ribosomal protein L25 [Flavobacteriales bacterium]MBK7268223.1 50S ribosomal protein L25 [Flavobacteriales bacterium]MBK9073462.1 50S ribosomal protein L25 [Flavobacteriales bacterium]
MKKVALTGTLREVNGTKNAAQLRRNKQVPCVLYGGGKVVHFAAEEAALSKLVFTAEAYRIELDLGGDKVMAKMQETQFHPTSDKILHTDFIELAEDKAAKVSLSLKLTGLAAGVRKGGSLNQTLRKLRVSGLPANLPEHLEYNVDALELGQSVRVRDLKFDGVVILEKPSDVVVKVSIPKKEAEVVAAPVVGAPAAAGAAAPAAAAAATPAAGAKKAEPAKPAGKK